MLLKNNDLRSNIYLKKMEKMARMDLGLDLVGYKDYINNLATFSQYNSDLTVLASDNLFGKLASGNTTRTMIELEAEKLTKDQCAGLERALKYSDAVLVSMSKILRKGATFWNAKDEAALADFEKNMGDYLAVNFALAERVRRFYKEQKLVMKGDEEWDILYEEMNNVTSQMLEEANVSQRQYEQMKMMISIDKDLLSQFGKRHAKYATENLLHDNFVDFTRLNLDKISKEAKSLLYRP